MQQTTHIYALICPNTKQVRYIGKSNNPTKRLYSHLTDGRMNHRHSWILSLKQKNQIPIVESIDEVNINEWPFWEQHYISLYKSFGFDLLNRTPGGEGSTCHELETRRSFAGENNPMFGKKRPEVGVKSRELRKGKTYEDIYGKEKALIIRKKISNGEKRRPVSEIEKFNFRQRMCKKIKQFDLNGVFIKEWDSLKEANESVSKTKSCAGLSRCLNKNKESFRGYKWTFSNIK